MYFKHLSVNFLILAIFITTVVCLKKDQFYCEMSSPCVCVSANNEKIDLGGIKVTLNMTDNVTLNYIPCPNDQLNSTAAIELVNSTSNTTMQLAYYTDVQFEIGDAVMLIYKNNTNEFDVILSCDPSAISGKEYLTEFQNDTSNSCKIVLKTSQVCGLNLKDSYDNNGSEAWTIFFSLILIVAFIYFVCGSIINACLFNEIGVNMIPHHVFWCSLYNNIKEKLCGTSVNASVYESI